MSKSLKTIQVLAKIGMIISKVMFILSVVCGIACFVALTALLGVQELRLGGMDPATRKAPRVRAGGGYTELPVSVEFDLGQFNHG